MNPNCNTNHMVLKIIVPDSIEVQYNHSIDDLLYLLMNIVARNVCPCTISLLEINAENSLANSNVVPGTVIETVLQERCRATIWNVVTEIASALRYFVIAGTPQMILNDRAMDFQSIDDKLLWIQLPCRRNHWS